MAYFPFFIDLQEQPGLLVGGGTVAFRKVQALVEFGAVLTIVAPDFCRSLENMAEADDTRAQVLLVRRPFQKRDLEGQCFVIAATSDNRLNHSIAQLCRERKLMVNVVDQKEDCSFYFPSLIKKGDLVTGISSGGNSPLLARRLRQRMEKSIPDYYPELNEQLGALRERIKAEITEEAVRRECFEELASSSESCQRCLSQEEVDAIIAKYVSG